MSDTVDSIQIARALGDEMRSRICCLLSVRDLCVCELTKVLHLSQATISDHLHALAGAGLVSSYQHSYWTHYLLVSDLPSDVAPFVTTVIRQSRDKHADDMVALAALPSDVCSVRRQEKRPHGTTPGKAQS
jgi:ArsR family transcriptional regulator